MAKEGEWQEGMPTHETLLFSCFGGLSNTGITSALACLEVVKELGLAKVAIGCLPSVPLGVKPVLEKAKAILEKTSVKFNLVSVLNPNTPKIITGMAEDEKFDLIVVGSRGIGAIHAYLIGNVCNKICYDSSVSVLIVK